MSKVENVGEEVGPRAGALVESLRDLGYTLPSALADLIDNSVANEASEVRLWIVGPTEEGFDAVKPHIAILDNGRGMGLRKLVEAMRMGGEGPEEARRESDLGRFGLGLKTASLSQGRRFTVVTKNTQSEVISRCWDIGHIKKTDKFELLTSISTEVSDYMSYLDKFDSGTLVVIEELDRPQFIRPGKSKQRLLASALEDVQFHLGMVFHRFIEDGDLKIFLGEEEIEPWDPFVRNLSTKSAEEVLQLNGSPVKIVPYILPHRSSFGDDEKAHQKAGGQKGWQFHQGFYIYRNKRLIVPGTWLNLEVTKELHYNLARIQVDISNEQDEFWHLNVMKSHVAAPSALHDDFTRIAKAVRGKANDVFRVRGERESPSKPSPIVHLWTRKEEKYGVSFRVNRQHPAIDALLQESCRHVGLLGDVLSLIERHLPLTSIVQNQTRVLDGISESKDQDIEKLWALYNQLVEFYVRSGEDIDEAQLRLLRSHPFASYADDLKERLSR